MKWFLLTFVIGCGAKVGMPITSIDNACDHVTWTFVPNFLCDTPECVPLPADQKDPAGAIDGDLATRWTSGRSQGSGGVAETVTVTFAAPVTIRGISLLTTVADDGPAAYRVEHSEDGVAFTGFNPPLAGAGSDTLTIQLPVAATTHAVRVVQTGGKTHGWSINELSTVGCSVN
ncbi:MAG TPA: discoidin domain-containing protein [Polyangia bacterium]